MSVKRYLGMVHFHTTPDGHALADAEPRSVVLAEDYDRAQVDIPRWLAA